MGKLRKSKGGTKPGASGKKKAPKRSAKGSKKKTLLAPLPFQKKGVQAVSNYLGISTPSFAQTGVPHKRKRINPMNAKAARRAASRVRSSIKMLERLKSSLPRVSTKGRVVAPAKKRR